MWRQLFTRDNAVWGWTALATGVTGLAGHLEMFPFIPPKWQHVIELTSFLISLVTAKMGYGLLPSKAEVKQQAVADQVAKDTGVPAVVVATTTTATLGNPPTNGKQGG